jgi:hypothetical protein
MADDNIKWEDDPTFPSMPSEMEPQIVLSDEFDKVSQDMPTKERGFSLSNAASEKIKEDPYWKETVKAVGAGGVQGATYNTLDEIMAALGTAGLTARELPERLKELAGVEKTTEPVADRYRRLRDAYRKQFKDIEETSPVAYGAGQFGGALFAPIPGGTVAGTMGAAGKLAKVPLSQAFKTAAKEGAGTGTKGGALWGAGTSEADLTKGDVGGFAKDVVTTGAVGATVGPALAVGGTAIVSGTKAVNDFVIARRAIRDMVDIADETSKGIPIIGQKENIDKAIREETHRFLKNMADVNKNMQELRTKGLEGATIEGKIINIDAKIQDNLAKIEQWHNQGILDDAKYTQLKSVLEDQLLGAEKTITKVVPGVTVPSGEETALAKLQTMQAKLRAAKEAGQPEAVAEQQLRKQYAKKELTAENPPEEFPVIESQQSLAGPEVKYVNTEGMGTTSSVVKDIQPGEMKTITDPVTGQKTMGFTDEATGKFTSVPVSEEASYTPVTFKKEKVREGGVTDLSPIEYNQFIQQLKDLPAAQEKTVYSNIIKPHSETLGKEVPGYIDITNKMHDFMNVFKNFTGANIREGVSDTELLPLVNKIGDIIKGRYSNKNAARNFDEIMNGYTNPFMGKDNQKVRGLKEIAPEIAEIFEQRVNELYKQYNLADAIEKAIDTTLHLGTFLTGGAGTIARTSAAGFGKVKYLAKQTTEATKQLSSEAISSGVNILTNDLANATPEKVRAIGAALQKQFGRIAEPFTEVLSRMYNVSPQRRNSMIFSLMQNPSFRQMYGAVSKPEPVSNNASAMTTNGSSVPEVQGPNDRE